MNRTARFALLAALLVPAVGMADNFAGSIDFAMGIATSGEAEFEVPQGDGSTKTETAESELSSVAFGITPALDLMLGKSVGIGGEMGFWWFSPDNDGEAQMVLAPHARVRMSFPIVDRVTFDGVFGIGPHIWTSYKNEAGQTQDSRFGWGLRFGFGGGYEINDSVSAFGQFGYFTSTTYGDDITMSLNTLPLSAGLRGSF
jgi:hypothetical protein